MQPTRDLRQNNNGDSSHPVLDLIMQRRSFRGPFATTPVPEASIARIVSCGLAAPSSKNAKPWRLHILTDRPLITELADAVACADGADGYVPVDPITALPRGDWPSSVAESAATLRGATLAIFVENTGAFSRGRATIAATTGHVLQANLVTYTLEVLGLGTAVMNMWLAALAEGAEASFIGDVCVAESAIAARLKLRCDLVGVLAIGYAASPAPQRQRAFDLGDADNIVWHRPGS